VARAIATNITNCCIILLATIHMYILYSSSNLSSLCVSAYSLYLFGRCDSVVGFNPSLHNPTIADPVRKYERICYVNIRRLAKCTSTERKLEGLLARE
jgi:hypothetical protein